MARSSTFERVEIRGDTAALKFLGFFNSKKIKQAIEKSKKKAAVSGADYALKRLKKHLYLPENAIKSAIKITDSGLEVAGIPPQVRIGKAGISGGRVYYAGRRGLTGGIDVRIRKDKGNYEKFRHAFIIRGGAYIRWRKGAKLSRMRGASVPSAFLNSPQTFGAVNIHMNRKFYSNLLLEIPLSLIR